MAKRLKTGVYHGDTASYRVEIVSQTGDSSTVRVIRSLSLTSTLPNGVTLVVLTRKVVLDTDQSGLDR